MMMIDTVVRSEVGTSEMGRREAQMELRTYGGEPIVEFPNEMEAYYVVIEVLRELFPDIPAEKWDGHVCDLCHAHPMRQHNTTMRIFCGGKWGYTMFPYGDEIEAALHGRGGANYPDCRVYWSGWVDGDEAGRYRVDVEKLATRGEVVRVA